MKKIFEEINDFLLVLGSITLFILVVIGGVAYIMPAGG